MKKSIILILSCFCFILSVRAQYIDRAPIEVEYVSNLLKWSDLIVVAAREKYSDSIHVEEFILNKLQDVDSNSHIELNTLIEYDHLPPVVMDGYRYLFFLTVLDEETKPAEAEGWIICKITGGQNGVVALFDLDELENHPRMLRSKRIMPQYDRIKTWNKRLQKNFGTTDGLKIKEAVERVVALYAEEDPKAQAEQLIESLRDGNPAMIRLGQELLQSIDLDAID